MTTIPHRVLVIGVGSIGERHVRCLQSTERCEVGFVEINASLRAGVAERYSITSHYDSLTKALVENWDAAVIATPADTHIPIALQLTEANLHLLIEKPLSTRLDDIDILIEKIREKNLIAGVAYVYRAHPAAQKLYEHIKSGEYGKPVQLTLMSGQNFPFYRPAYREIYYTDRKRGGGAIQDGLTHFLNLTEWLVGPIDRVVADADHKVLEGVEVEDTVHVLARHGEVQASYAYNQHQAPNESRLTVICERGALRIELPENRFCRATEPGGGWQVENLENLDRDAWFIFQEQAFIDAIEGKAPPLCSLEEGAHTLKVTLKILEGADTQKGFHSIES